MKLISLILLCIFGVAATSLLLQPAYAAKKATVVDCPTLLNQQCEASVVKWVKCLTVGSKKTKKITTSSPCLTASQIKGKCFVCPAGTYLGIIGTK